MSDLLGTALSVLHWPLDMVGVSLGLVQLLIVLVVLSAILYVFDPHTDRGCGCLWLVLWAVVGVLGGFSLLPAGVVKVVHILVLVSLYGAVLWIVFWVVMLVVSMPIALVDWLRSSGKNE